MSPPYLHKRSFLALLILIAAGYAGNYFSLPLFFGIDFLFGSIAILLVVRFGTKWGTLAAIKVAAFTHNYLMESPLRRHHPYL